MCAKGTHQGTLHSGGLTIAINVGLDGSVLASVAVHMSLRGENTNEGASRSAILKLSYGDHYLCSMISLLDSLLCPYEHKLRT